MTHSIQIVTFTWGYLKKNIDNCCLFVFLFYNFFHSGSVFHWHSIEYRVNLMILFHSNEVSFSCLRYHEAGIRKQKSETWKTLQFPCRYKQKGNVWKKFDKDLKKKFKSNQTQFLKEKISFIYFYACFLLNVLKTHKETILPYTYCSISVYFLFCIIVFFFKK